MPPYAQEARAPEAGHFFAAHALALARHAALQFDGGHAHGALRGEFVKGDVEASDGDGNSGRLSHIVELWRPSPRCIVLLIGVAIFSAICACGASLALLATGAAAGDDTTSPGPSAGSLPWRTLERLCPCAALICERMGYYVRGPSYAAASTFTPARSRGGSAAFTPTGPSPRHRSAERPRYLCEPVLSPTQSRDASPPARNRVPLVAPSGGGFESASECSGSDVELLRRGHEKSFPSLSSFGSFGALAPLADSVLRMPTQHACSDEASTPEKAAPVPVAMRRAGTIKHAQPPPRSQQQQPPLPDGGAAPAPGTAFEPRSPRGDSVDVPVLETAPNVLSDLESDTDTDTRSRSEEPGARGRG